MEVTVEDGDTVFISLDSDETEDLEINIRVIIEPDDEPEYLTPSVCRISCLSKTEVVDVAVQLEA